MKKVWVYDVDAERLDKLEEQTQCTTPEIVEALLDLLETLSSVEELKAYLP